METLQHVGDSIKAHHIQVPLVEAYSCTFESDPSIVSENLRKFQFDTCPVMENEVPIGSYTPPGRQTETIEDGFRALHPSQLVSSETSLIDLAKHLCDEPFLYVLCGTGICGLVTGNDLAKPAARSYAYLQISALESSLADYLRAKYPDQIDGISLLNPSRRAACASLIEELREKDQFVDEFCSCSLQDLIDIAGTDQSFREAPVGGKGWRKLTTGLVGLRNDIMHPSRPLIHPQGLTVQKFTDRLANLQELLRRTTEAAERLELRLNAGEMHA